MYSKTGVSGIFLFLLKNRDCWYSLEPPRLTSTHNLRFEQKYENYLSFLSENFQFSEGDYIYIYMNRRGFVMCSESQSFRFSYNAQLNILGEKRNAS